ncbi:MAG: serine/threonine protein kinase [Deltaproteobacteria bacterium]|nr:serine/threonine protein kinase [Deltaproteobacteria bacterium]
MAHCPHCDSSHAEGTDYCPRTGRPIADVATRMIGRTIAGKYKLTKCIGQGGMGTIFEAEHNVIGSKMAMKLLHEPFATSREPVQRLYREARATGTIGHPNIIQVFDVGETAEGTPFLVMELLRGESLGDHLETNGPRPLGFVLDVGVQILSALHAAHSAGIIHRDLKSDNVFLTETAKGKPHQTKLLDFGVSKFILQGEDLLKLTQTGSILGTPYYMSPEQASGMKDLDFRLDIYAAGVILYEMLTGAVPHKATNYNALLMEIISSDVRPFAWQRPDVPPELEAAVLKAMSRDRQNRWEHALDLMDELNRIRDHLSIQQLNDPASVIQGNNSVRVNRNAKTIDSSETLLSEEPDTPFFVETDAEMPVPRASPRKRIFALGGALASFFVMIGVILFASNGTGDVEKPTDRQEHLATAQGERAASTLATRVESSSSKRVLDEAKQIRLRVTRSPQEAVITVDGRIVSEDGIDLEAGSSPLFVIAEAEGFETKKLEITPSEDLDIEMRLVRLSESGEASSKTRDRKRRKRGKSKKKNASVSAESVPGGKASENNPKGKDGKSTQALDRPMDNPF